MPVCLLVKHAMPKVAPGVAACEWRLSEEGRRACLPLSRRLADFQPGVVVTSTEPKSVETGSLVAANLEISCESAEDLHEHRRQTVGYLSKEGFSAGIQDLFARPDQLVFGEETASLALRRFTASVQGVVARFPGESVVIVSHGTVISLLISELTDQEAYPVWSSLGLPSIVVLSSPVLDFIETISHIE